MSRIIYALKCPFVGEIHYIGKSTSGMVRPLTHMRESHSEKINEWVKELKSVGQIPTIEILEKVSEMDNIDDREKYFINKYWKKGNLLLNLNNISSQLVNDKLNKLLDENEKIDLQEIATFVKERRKQVGLSQEELADKAGIALTVLRKIEQNKSNINLEGLLTILKMFGHTLTIKKIKQ